MVQSVQYRILPVLETPLSEIGKQRKVTLKWKPSHFRVIGNEGVDQVAKKCATPWQPEASSTSYRMKRVVKTIRISPKPT